MKNCSNVVLLNFRKKKIQLSLIFTNNFTYQPEFHTYMQFLTNCDTVCTNLIYNSDLHWENSVLNNVKLLAVKTIGS